ncbi:hypothetical protein B0J11DRAFT_607587 [Dendryphion nanum]|uniref:Uncharacterized protein n=1 Tax=Dendryphion nanum TaxID=256645 RepID=A0A9P9IJ09_9PLEO|nr:hypothetical protein B0J11DRAFT_607587 [Dendryphion nanum]
MPSLPFQTPGTTSIDPFTHIVQPKQKSVADFTIHRVYPHTPTLLGNREWLPLQPTDLSIYPTVNSYTFPGRLDEKKLRSSLSKTLQRFPPYSGSVQAHPKDRSLQIKLDNSSVQLTIGETDEPGPFAAGWKGEEHPDYFDDLPRGSIHITTGPGTPLFKAKATTWRKTGQTHLFVSQSYALGDGFAMIQFMKCWSEFYQGKDSLITPTFEKYSLPPPQLPARVNNIKDIESLSFMLADFPEDFHRKRWRNLEIETERVEYCFDGIFVRRVWDCIQRQSGEAKIALHDAFSGYLISVLQSILVEPVSYLQQLITLRGRTFSYNGKPFTIPKTSMGNAYIIWGCDLGQACRKTHPLRVAQLLKASRNELRDENKLGRSYMWYNAFYERSISRNQQFIEVGYPDTIGINWLVNAGLNDPHFGYEKQQGHIEYESLENFIQIWRANATKQADGSWSQDPDGLQIVLRLKTQVAAKFRQRMEEHRKKFVDEGGPNLRAAPAMY